MLFFVLRRILQYSMFTDMKLQTPQEYYKLNLYDAHVYMIYICVPKITCQKYISQATCFACRFKIRIKNYELT